MDPAAARLTPRKTAPRTPASASRRQGFLLLATAVVAWGFGWPVNKLILYDLSPLWAVALRSAIAALTLFAISTCRRSVVLPSREDLPVLLSIALLHMVGYAVLVSIGLLFVPVGRSVVLAYTTPLWVMPGATIFLGERLTSRRATGVAIGLLGLAILFNPLGFEWHDRDAVIGNCVLLGAAFLWAANILHIRGHRWHATPFDLVPWEMLLATLVLTALATLLGKMPEVHWTSSLVLLLLYSGIPGSAIAFWAAAVASRNLPAITTSLGLLGAPVVGIIASGLTLGEAPSVWLITAMSLIVGGIAIGTVDAEPGD
jgi:drug/metabolite transporter (DMT)-like permease